MHTNQASRLELPGYLEIVLGDQEPGSDSAVEHVLRLRDNIEARGSDFFGNVYLLSISERFSQQQAAILARQLGLAPQALSVTNPVGRDGQLDAGVLADLAAWVHQALVFGERIAVAVPAGGSEVVALLLAGIRIRHGSAETEAIEARFAAEVQAGEFTAETFELLLGMYMTGKLHHRNANELAMLDGRPNAARLARILDRQLKGAPVLVEQQGPGQTAVTFALQDEESEHLACTLQVMEDPAVVRVRTFAPARLAAGASEHRRLAAVCARLNLTLSPEVIQLDQQGGTVSGSSVAMLPSDEQSALALLARLIERSADAVTEVIPVLDELAARDSERLDSAVRERNRKVATRTWML